MAFALPLTLRPFRETPLKFSASIKLLRTQCLETLHAKIDENVSTIRIVDVNGRTSPVAFNSEESNHSVDVSILSSGLFILEITTETNCHYAMFLKDPK